jgi:hypothetical protein
VSFAAIALCIASQRVFIVVDFVIDSIRKILGTASYKKQLPDPVLSQMNPVRTLSPYLLKNNLNIILPLRLGLPSGRTLTFPE